MAKPNPYAGLVIRYDYLWKSEYQKGREEGAKDRPCAVVVATKDGRTALVCGITHSEPEHPKNGILISPTLRRNLGLDSDPQWIITNELNEVEWSDPGIVPLPSGDWSYGDLPRGLAEEILESVREHHSGKRLEQISRPKIEKARSAREAEGK